MTKFFRIKKKPYFGVIFAQREFFPKTPAMHNCSGPSVIKCQRYRKDWSNQKLFHHYQHAKIVVRVPRSVRPQSFLNMPTQ